MGMEVVMAAVLLIAAALGSYRQGRRNESRSSVTTALETVNLLQVQIETLVERGEEKDQRIATLEGRVNVLNDLVTQRAEVEAVHADLLDVKETVVRIAAKVGA